jgi:uncharacterized membrane protein YtjA (UPF0391 family)
MLGLVLTLLIITIILAILGFSLAMAALKVLFWIFLALFIISLIAHLFRGHGRPIVTP